MICGYIREGATKRHALFAVGECDAQANAWLRCETSVALNEVGGANLTLPWSILAVRSLTQKNAVIELEDDGETVFIGELASVIRKDPFYRVELELDGALGWLGNICKPPFALDPESSNGPAQAFLTAIIAQYNAAVGAERQIALGVVTVPGRLSMDHNEEYVTMLDLLREVREQLGGYYFMTYATGTPTLHYIVEPTEAPGQVLELGRNVLTVESQLNFDDYASRIYITGTDEDNNLISSCAMSAEAETTFGRVDRAMRGEGKTTGEIYAEALAELNVRKAPIQSLTMTAAELSDAGAEWRLFHLGTARRAICEPLGIDTYMTVQRVKRDHLDRARSEVTLGCEPRTLTRMM